MNLIISFSGRAKGNCDSIAEFVSNQEDQIIYFRDKNIHACSRCEYFEKWFECSEYENRVLGIERHKYNQKMQDSILDMEEVRMRLREFLLQ